MNNYLKLLCILILAKIAISAYTNKANFTFKNKDSIFKKIRTNTSSLGINKGVVFFPDMGDTALQTPDGKLVWVPENIKTNRDKYSWLETIKIHYDIQNNYVKEDNITIVNSHENYINYDFRKVATNLDRIFREAKIKCEAQGAYIAAEKFGCTLANLFLIRQEQSWKDKYIKGVHYIDPYIAGTTKSLLVLMSGENVNNIERPFFRTIIRNYSCLLMSLPNPDVFEDQILIQHKDKEYTADDIYKLLTLTGATDSAELYKNICLPLQREAYADPGIPVEYSITSKNKTPIMFKYEDNLLDYPEHIYYSSHKDELNLPALWRYV